jgi:hypothetical protein
LAAAGALLIPASMTIGNGLRFDSYASRNR